MVFLPIVERELRVAARKPSTFWVRVLGVLAALLLVGGFLLLSTLGAGGGAPTLGRALFAVLTWLGLAAALSVGLFFTSDCLSCEKRDGTLGFLFLTDLKGHDVVLGKLLATSLRAVCTMLGAVPLLGVTLLMGGVTGGQFWRTCVALASTLFFSLAVGLFVSAFSRASQVAMGGTLLLLGLVAGGGPAADGLWAVVRSGSFEPLLSLSSPVFLFLAASQPGGGLLFGESLATNQLVIWLMLGTAFWVLPRTWREKSTRSSLAARSWVRPLRIGTVRQRESLRRALLGDAPILWLMCRERWQATLVWALALVTAIGFAFVFSRTEQIYLWYGASYLGGATVLALYLGIASHAGKFFLDTRQSGFMELLLVAPTTPEQIVRGQARALVRMFGLPLIILLAVHLVGGLVVQYLTYTQMASATAAMPAPAVVATNSSAATTNAGWTSSSVSVSPASTAFAIPSFWVSLASGTAGTVVVAANLVALGWFGMWMGLTSKSINLATLKTLLFVQVIPWFAISVGAGLISAAVLVPAMLKGGGSPSSGFMTWYPLISVAVAAVLGLLKDVGLVVYARRRLFVQFRERAGQTFGRTQSPLPPILRPSATAANAVALR